MCVNCSIGVTASDRAWNVVLTAENFNGSMDTECRSYHRMRNVWFLLLFIITGMFIIIVIWWLFDSLTKLCVCVCARARVCVMYVCRVWVCVCPCVCGGKIQVSVDVVIWKRTRPRPPAHIQQTRELIGVRKTSHKHNKDLSWVTAYGSVTLTWQPSKYKVHKLHQRYIKDVPNLEVNLSFVDDKLCLYNNYALYIPLPTTTPAFLNLLSSFTPGRHSKS